MYIFLQVLLNQPVSSNLYGFIADILEKKLEQRMEDDNENKIQPPSRLTPQNSLERKVTAITSESVKSATLDPKSPVKRKLRREGTFNIYDSGKKKSALNTKCFLKKL